MAQAVKSTLSLPGLSGVEITINYNANNHRLTSVDWIIPARVIVTAWVRRAGVLIYSDTITGPASGSAGIPGNIAMVQTIEAGETFWDLPPDITYAFNMETIG
jgi:hypothetical protein